MPSFYAKPSTDPTKPLNVLFVVYPGIVLLDLVGPLQVFTHVRKDSSSSSAYRTKVVSRSGGRIETNTILQIDSDPIQKWLGDAASKKIDTLIVVGGDGAIPAALDDVFVRQVKRLAAQSDRICSVCSGALIIAAAGLLDGKRAVTHWEDCERLSKQYPTVKVEVDPIFIKDGNTWTSAGITAGIDMALAIVEEDLGKPAAIEMARSLVAPMVRSGGQSQFSQELDRQARDVGGRFKPLHDWISSNPSQKISVEVMAKRCGMSSRTFSRQYVAIMGKTPANAIEAIRVNLARDMLNSTELAIKTVAARCGFEDDERMRRAFQRQIKTSPSKYQKQFR